MNYTAVQIRLHKRSKYDHTNDTVTIDLAADTLAYGLPCLLHPMFEQDDLQGKIATAPELPGVYSFYATESLKAGTSPKPLYVGKAKNLRKRLQSYVRGNLPVKTARLMRQVTGLSTTVTNNETEALLLEQTLIKQHRPRFNILLRDDKSYPFLHLSAHQDYPWLMVRRGNQVKSGKLFGPYSSGYSLRETLKLLQQVFRLRQCSDDFFANRSRPCLQYQIGRCSAPCVGYITSDDYHKDLELAIKSIRGQNNAVVKLLQQDMDIAASSMDYEKAAKHRDKLILLRKVQEQQNVNQQVGTVDVIVACSQYSAMCIQHIIIRNGKLVSSKSHFPLGRLLPDIEQDVGANSEEADLIEQFISQHHVQVSYSPEMPRELIVNHPLAQRELLELALEKQQGRRVKIVSNPRGDRAEWLRLAEKNAKQALSSRLLNKRNHFKRMAELANLLSLEQPIVRMECFDISHTFGEAAVASCVVFGAEGPIKANYRLFNLHDITAGDDYAAMHQVITRRFSKISIEDTPQLLCIDGGKGQVMSALRALDELDISLLVMGISKGPMRKAGLETLFVYCPGMPLEASALRQIQLRPESPALHIIQQIRDESHRFALQHHRKRRAKSRKISKLEGIAGVGAVKRHELLRFFGSLAGVTNASERDLGRVNGISKSLAGVIYQHLHSA